MVSNAVRWLVWVLFLAGGGVLGVWLDLRLWPAWWHNPFWHLVSALAGVGVFRIVLTVSRVTGRWLARCGRVGELPRMETNRLVTVGPYACMRHPMHLGLMLFPLAFALVLGSPAFVLLVWPLEVLAIVLLVLFVEEREARLKFGADYAAYARRVPAFNLAPACLAKLLQDPPERPDCTNTFRIAEK